VNRPGEAVRLVVIVRHRFAEVVAAVPPHLSCAGVERTRTLLLSVDSLKPEFLHPRQATALHRRHAAVVIPTAYIKSGHLLPLSADETR
jgi:hypothetical protein